jgi:hypothetical protein
MERSSRIQRWFGTSGGSVADPAVSRATQFTPPDLRTIRAAMTLVLNPCTESHRLRAAVRIELAESAIDLWLLRAEIFQYLAQDLGQKTAAQEMMRLDPLFNGLVPCVAASQKSPDNRAHERYLP